MIPPRNQLQDVQKSSEQEHIQRLSTGKINIMI